MKKTSDNVSQSQIRGMLRICDYGIIEYRKALELQLRLHEQRLQGKIPDTILILEHSDVITLGARQSANKMLADEAELKSRGIDLVQIRRGGGTTAHNPGQLVFYPILDLGQLGIGISDYIRGLEGMGCELLEQLGVKAQVKKGFPGLWVGEKKIASIGVRAPKMITSHGIAINICNDLGIFDLFVPCGLDGVAMTSALKEVGGEISMDTVKEKLVKILTDHFASKELVEYEKHR